MSAHPAAAPTLRSASGVAVAAALVVAVAAVVLVGPAARPAGACSCMSLTDVEAFTRADAVFVGELVDVEMPAEPGSSLDPVTWSFAVSEAHKGEVSATQEVVSKYGGASCGLELPHEGEFVVFAQRGDGFLVHPEPGQLYAGLCGGTRLASASQPSFESDPSASVLVAAGPEASADPPESEVAAAEDPAAAPPATHGPSRSTTPWIVAVVALVAVSAAVVAGLVRRRRHAGLTRA